MIFSFSADLLINWDKKWVQGTTLFSGLDGDTVLDKAHVEEITEYLVEIKIKFFEGLGFPPDNDVSITSYDLPNWLTHFHWTW